MDEKINCKNLSDLATSLKQQTDKLVELLGELLAYQKKFEDVKFFMNKVTENIRKENVK